MPKDYATGNEMDASAYGGRSSGAVTPPEGETPDPNKSGQSVDQENQQMATTTLVPLKILSPDGSPLKEGDQRVVQVVKVHGDEVEIKYSPESPKEDTGTGQAVDYESDFKAMDHEDRP